MQLSIWMSLPSRAFADAFLVIVYVISYVANEISDVKLNQFCRLNGWFMISTGRRQAASYCGRYLSMYLEMEAVGLISRLVDKTISIFIRPQHVQSAAFRVGRVISRLVR